MTQYQYTALIAIALLLVLILTGCAQQGNMGTPGVQGAPGDTGPIGAPGKDANPVKIVQLCPGTTMYPSTYVEIAFCVDSKLYGTYSANGGFSTELPPGNYSSNAIGSSCNFTILSNCVIQ